MEIRIGEKRYFKDEHMIRVYGKSFIIIDVMGGHTAYVQTSRKAYIQNSIAFLIEGIIKFSISEAGYNMRKLFHVDL